MTEAEKSRIDRKARRIQAVWAGIAWLEYCGRLYEMMWIRDTDGRYGFADVNDGSPLFLNMETLMSDACDVQFKLEDDAKYFGSFEQ